MTTHLSDYRRRQSARLAAEWTEHNERTEQGRTHHVIVLLLVWGATVVATCGLAWGILR